ncbi:uncharacterized protein [Primulina eburnea]|uniref:uncharacterized protein n=1 Tax=Primulina eburnea TaxID=1245227 RepID=UPI003C6BF639
MDLTVLGHKIYIQGIEVDKAKVKVITNLPPPASVKGVRSFPGHSGIREPEGAFGDSSYVAGTVLGSTLRGNVRPVIRRLVMFYGGTRWILHLQKLDLEIKDKNGVENIVADHLSWLEHVSKNCENEEIVDWFPDEQLLEVKNCLWATHKISTPYHFETSGQVEVSNHEIKRILEKVVGINGKDWLLRLDDALWAYMTPLKTPIGEHKLLQLDHLEEFRGEANNLVLNYKEHTKQARDKRITPKEFKEGEAVLFYNFMLRSSSSQGGRALT